MNKHMNKTMLPVFALVCFAAMAADDPPAVPAKPFRPIPDVPEVLIYEDFELPNPVFDKGKILLLADEKLIGPPGSHCYELGKKDDKDKWVWTEVQINKSPLKFPDGMAPNSINLQFNIYAEDSGTVEVTIKYKDKDGDGDYTDSFRLNKEKQWTPVTFKYGEFRNKNVRADAKHVVSIIEIKFRPRLNSKYIRVFIDDVIVTGNGVLPNAILPKIANARRETTAIMRTAAKDGFTYNIRFQDEMRSAIKTAAKKRKQRTVLVMGARPADSAELTKDLTAAATKGKLTGFAFVSSTNPESAPISGLEEMRMLLQYNLQKTDAELAILMLNYSDVTKSAKSPGESLKVILSRAVQSGVVPVVCLAPANDKAKVDPFNNMVSNLCIDMGVPFIDPNVAVKGEVKFYEANEYNTAGMESIANLALTAVKHFDTYLFGRK